MPFMPFNILGIWLRGLLSIAILAGGIYLLKEWYDRSHVTVSVPSTTTEVRPAPTDPTEVRPGERRRAEPAAPVETRRVFQFDPGWNRETAMLAGGLALLVWAFLGQWVGQAVSSLLGSAGVGVRPRGSDDEPRAERTGEVHHVRRADGSDLRVECYGPSDGVPIIMTHGWGATSEEWYYQKKALTDRFRLIVWDEPGLGLSRKPDNNDYSMENLAADLEAVLTFANDRRAILLGHSIGGMITLTFCRLFPGSLGTRVAGLVLAHTTYTNPVRTTSMAALYTALEKPVLVPLMYVTIALWPLAWLLNWMSYLNGSAHRSTHKQSFSGHETRGQLDFVAAFMPHARPDVLARGMLGMIKYDATDTLKTIGVPVLSVVGDLDTTTPPEAGQYIARNVPNGTLQTLSPAKHMGLLEHHARFNTRVSEFVDSLAVAAV